MKFGVKLVPLAIDQIWISPSLGSPHVPSRCADELLFVPDDEAELPVELDVLWSVSFEVASGSLLFELLDIAIH